MLFNKTTATGRKLVIVDASMTELIRPALYGSYHNIENITSEDEARDKYTIVGGLPGATDVFVRGVTLRKTRAACCLRSKSAGAWRGGFALQPPRPARRRLQRRDSIIGFSRYRNRWKDIPRNRHLKTVVVQRNSPFG